MASITFGGIASGLDTNSIVDGLVKAEKAPLDQLTAQQTKVSSAQTSMATFLSNVSALDKAVTSLADSTSFASLSATSSSSAVVATTIGAPVPGSYTLDVISLASEQRTRSATFGSATDPLNKTGTLAIKVGTGGTSFPVNVVAGDSLSSIAAKITSSGARVNASVLFDGTQYRLLVRGLDSGAANSIAFDDGTTGLGLSTAANTYQPAADSHIKLDGMDVTRSTNVIQGAIAGVTFALKAPTTTSTTVTVAEDTDALATKLQSFVSAFNNVTSSGHFTAGYGTTKAQAALLQGDSSVRTVLDKLASMVTTPVPGTSGKYTTLASVGLSVAGDGSISLDTTKLTAAMADDPASIEKLFVTDASKSENGIMGQLQKTLDSWTVGTTSLLQGRISSLQKTHDDLGSRIDEDQKRLDSYQAALQAQFTALELTLARIKSDGSALDSLVTTNYYNNSSSK